MPFFYYYLCEICCLFLLLLAVAGGLEFELCRLQFRAGNYSQKMNVQVGGEGGVDWYGRSTIYISISLCHFSICFHNLCTTFVNLIKSLLIQLEKFSSSTNKPEHSLINYSTIFDLSCFFCKQFINPVQYHSRLPSHNAILPPTLALNWKQSA